MKIGIDVREITKKNFTGKGYYIFNLLKELLKQDQKNQYFLYSDSKLSFPKIPKNFKFILIKKPSIFWHLACIRDMKRRKLDLFWATTSYLVPFLTRKIPCIITVYDLNVFVLNKKQVDPKARFIEKLTLPVVVKRAQKIIAISKSTAQDLTNFFSVQPSKIKIIYGAADQQFKPIKNKTKKLKILKKYHLKQNYIFFVSTLEPRKNLLNLIKAYNLLSESLKKRYSLVLAGKKGWFFEQIFLQVEQLKLQNRIKFLGYVPEKDLPALYSNSSLFVYPSFYEGFGLPVLEAMNCGAPVITSNISSLPEVVGKAALLVNPHKPKEIKKAMERILNNPKLSHQLRLIGFSQAKNFSWHQSCQKLIKILEN